MQDTILKIKRSTSRGQDTYGYIIITLTDGNTGKKYRTSGGGYDMRGSVLGEWLNTVYATELKALASLAEGTIQNGQYNSRRDKNAQSSINRNQHYYGLLARYDAKGNVERVSIDGACGVSEVMTVARAIGLSIEYINILDAYHVTPLTGLDKIVTEQALEQGMTVCGYKRFTENLASTQAAVAETNE